MKTKMVIIGATGSAYKRTIPGLKNSVICEVVAIQGRNEKKLKSICAEYQINEWFFDVSEMLKKTTFDIIYIANPPFMHYESLMQAIKTNKPIICEKPLDIGYKEVLKYASLLSEYSSPIMVAHHLRHQKAMSDIKEIILSGKIGTVRNVFCQWGFQMNTEAPSAIWKLDPTLGGGGTFSDNGIHIVDLIIDIFGKPNYVCGQSIKTAFEKVYDTETAILFFTDKTVTLNASQNMKFPGNHLLIYGTKGKIEALQGIGEKYIKSLTITTVDGEEIKEYQPVHLYGAEVENFIRFYLRNDKTVPVGTTFAEALLALRIIDAVRKSSAEKFFVEV